MIGYTATLHRCLQLNALALAFSLAHTVADFGVIFAPAEITSSGGAVYLAVAAAVYG